MKAYLTLAAAGLLTLAGCDGAKENAGEQADAAAGETMSEDSMAQGTAEETGEAMDSMDSSAAGGMSDATTETTTTETTTTKQN
jgi:hypothetical protein